MRQTISIFQACPPPRGLDSAGEYRVPHANVGAGAAAVLYPSSRHTHAAPRLSHSGPPIAAEMSAQMASQPGSDKRLHVGPGHAQKDRQPFLTWGVVSAGRAVF